MSDELTRAIAVRLASLERKTQRIEAQEYTGGTATGGAGTAVFNDASGNPAEVGTAALDGISAYAARLDHVHEFPRALMFSDASGNPIAVGTASASDGTIAYAARLDHVHTLDFSRGLMFNDAEGNPVNVGTVSSDGVSTYAARRDHVHAYAGGGAGSVTFNDAEGDPIAVGTAAASDGTSAYPARRDHTHTLDFSRSLMFSDAEGNPVNVGTVAASDGTSTYAARRDHVHTLDFSRSLMFDDASGTPLATGVMSLVGTSTYASRSDHVHEESGSGAGTAVFSDVSGDPLPVGTAALDGVLNAAARLDHVHTLGSVVMLGTVQPQNGTATFGNGTYNFSGPMIAGTTLNVTGTATFDNYLVLNAPMTIGNDPSGDEILAARLQASNSFTITAGGSVAINEYFDGFAFIVCSTSSRHAAFICSNLPTTWEMSDPAGHYSATADSADQHNVYAQDDYVWLQNKYAVSRTYSVFLMGAKNSFALQI